MTKRKDKDKTLFWILMPSDSKGMYSLKQDLALRAPIRFGFFSPQQAHTHHSGQ
jgi:hypothetical protein